MGEYAAFLLIPACTLLAVIFGLPFTIRRSLTDREQQRTDEAQP